MPPKFHAILYNFFIQGLDLDRIAAIHETSWEEVAKVLDSEPAKELMRSAIRVERLRSIAQNLACRRAALQTLEIVTGSLDRSASGNDSRRRAATAILSGTNSRGRSTAPTRAHARAKATDLPPAPELAAPEPTKQPAPTQREPARKPVSQSAPPAPTTRAPESQPVRSRQNAPSSVNAPPHAFGGTAPKSSNGIRPDASPVQRPVPSKIGPSEKT